MEATPPTVHPALIEQPVHNPSHCLTLFPPLPCAKRRRIMQGYFLEINAKLFIRSNTSADDLPGDIYSHMAEFIRSDEDIIDIEVNAVPIPLDLCGSSPD